RNHYSIIYDVTSPKGGIQLKRNIRILMILLFSVLVMTGCKSQPDHDRNELIIYTSIYPIEYAVQQIGGETARVESIYPPGGDAHNYEPSTKKMTSIATSDAFFYLGADMEAFATTAADALKSEDVDLIE